MATDRRVAELKVGTTVIVALVVLIFGIIWGKNYRLASNQYRFGFLFQNTGGLRTNDAVSVNGVQKGHVTAITLERGKVRVDVALNRDVELYSDLRAYITTVELMGGKKVEIIPGGDGEKLDLDRLTAPLLGTQTAGFSEMLVGVTELAAQTTHLTKRLDSTLTLVHRFLDETEVRQPLVASVHDLSVATASLRDLIEENDELVNRTVANLDHSVGEIRTVIDRRRTELDSTLLAFHNASQRLEAFTETLEEISGRLNQREGTLSQLIYDDEIFHRLRSTAVTVDSMATQLSANLGRFLEASNFSLINVLSF